MLFLADTSEPLDKVAEELEGPVGQLLTPLNGFKNRGGRWAMDNGAFSGFDPKRFRRRLKGQEPYRDACLFVVAPDVVGSARRTLEVLPHWLDDLQGWPVALAAQDGLEDLPIPWDAIDALFVGGSTEWKLSRHAEACIRAAQALGKWVHVGRVNTATRVDKFEQLGVDSYDGSGISRFSHMRRKVADGLPLLDRGGAS
jgi:hypothetical protein